MLNRIIKFAAIALSLGLAIYSFIDGEIGNGIFFTILIAFPVILLFRHEYMIMTLWHLRKQNMEKASHFLNKIKDPEHLVKGQQAYYYYLQGFLIMTSQRQIQKADALFKKALSIGLRMKQDEAMAKLSLAQIAMTRRRKREAKNYIAEVKKIKESSSMKEQIKQLEIMLKRI